MKVNGKTIDIQYTLGVINKYITNFNKLTDETREAINVIISLDDNVSLTFFVSKYIKPIFKSSGTNSKQYWKSRGWDNYIEIASQIQKERSPRSVEYWKKKGFSEGESIEKVKELQKGYNKICLDKYKRNYEVFNIFNVDTYIRKGMCLDDAEKQISFNRLINKISNTKEYQMIVKGRSEGEIDIINKKKKTKNNFMKGKTPSIKCGSAISGKYKDYYFRSLLEFYFIYENIENNLIQCDIPLTESNYKFFIGNEKHYTPDFIIGNKIYEIKSSYGISVINNRNIEIDLVKEYFKNEGYEYIIIDERYFEKYNITMLEKEYQSKNVEFASDLKYNKYKKQLRSYYENC